MQLLNLLDLICRPNFFPKQFFCNFLYLIKNQTLGLKEKKLLVPLQKIN